MPIEKELKADTGLIQVLALIHSLNITRSGAILFFSWTVLQSREQMVPFASMLLIGELISMALSAWVGTKIAKHGPRPSFLVAETLFIVALVWYLLITVTSDRFAVFHAVSAYALMTFASIISYPASQTMLKLASSTGRGTRNASLSNISSTSAYVVGPALVGVVLTRFGAAAALCVCLFFAAVSIGLAYFIGQVKQVPGGTVASPIQPPESMKPRSALFLIAMISVIYSAFTFLATYLAPLALFQLKADADSLGALRSAWSIGAIIGTFFIAVLASRREPGLVFLVASALLWAIGLGVVSFSSTILSAATALVTAGLLFALTRSTFDGLLLRVSSSAEYPRLRTRAQAGASAISVGWILLAVALPPLQIGSAFLLFSALVALAACLFSFSELRSARPLANESPAR